MDLLLKDNHPQILKIEVAKWIKQIQKKIQVFFTSIHYQLLKIFAVDGGIKLPENSRH